MDVKIKVINPNCVPFYGREGDACLDCHASLGAGYIMIPDGSRCLVNLGFALELPQGYEAVVRPRSGYSKLGLDVSIGTVDSNYRGELKACVINNTKGVYCLHDLDRVCQIAIRKTEQINWVKVDELTDTNRGTNGFGSSGR